MPTSESNPGPAQPRLYQVTLEGVIDPSWSAWLAGMEILSGREADGRQVTVLTGAIPDQVALRGLLGRIWDLNLILLSVQQIDPPVPISTAQGSDDEHQPYNGAG